MIYNDLSVSITSTQGESLEEFKQSERGENSVECWIPSNEGSGFEIHWQPIRNFKPGLGLHCTIKLDGKVVTSGGLKPSKISLGLPGIKNGMTVAKGLRRLYVFGRHNITDRDDLASPDDLGREMMGTIQVTLSWVKYGRLRPRSEPYWTIEEPGYVHERPVKKGHLGAATLGAPVRKRSRGCIRDKEDAGFPKVVFLFRYGPKDWLEAKEIFVTERRNPPAQDSKPKLASRLVKKERESTVQSIPETLSSTTHQGQGDTPSNVIDVDELESDNDSEVIVLNDPIMPKSSTSLIKAEA